ncbi:hypothetical protein HDU76_003464, partial [Blyttiomyces sp. JEL0837]
MKKCPDIKGTEITYHSSNYFTSITSTYNNSRSDSPSRSDTRPLPPLTSDAYNTHRADENSSRFTPLCFDCKACNGGLLNYESSQTALDIVSKYESELEHIDPHLLLDFMSGNRELKFKTMAFKAKMEA